MKTLELPSNQDRLLSRLESWGISRDAIAVFLRCYSLVRYPRGAPLFANGASANLLLAVVSGIVKVYCRHGDGSRVLVELAGPGDFVSYGGFRAGALVRSQVFEARAVTSCCAAIFRRDRMVKELSAVDPLAMVRLAEAIRSKWLSLVYRYVSFLRISLRERLEAVFAELAARFGVADARGVIVMPELCQEELAEMVGGSRPMVSRLLAEMAREGVVTRDGRHYIVLRCSLPARDRAASAQGGPRVSSAGFAERVVQKDEDREGGELATERAAMVGPAAALGIAVAEEDRLQPFKLAARKIVSTVSGSARS